MIQRYVINKALKIRMLKFSNSFFSKLVQWLIEYYSTEATICSVADTTQNFVEISAFNTTSLKTIEYIILV